MSPVKSGGSGGTLTCAPPTRVAVRRREARLRSRNLTAVGDRGRARRGRLAARRIGHEERARRWPPAVERERHLLELDVGVDRQEPAEQRYLPRHVGDDVSKQIVLPVGGLARNDVVDD